MFCEKSYFTSWKSRLNLSWFYTFCNHFHFDFFQYYFLLYLWFLSLLHYEGMAVSWICFNLIIILHTKMSPKTWEAGGTILTATAERNKKTSHPWKLKISNCKIDSCSISFRISSHKLIKLLWFAPHRMMEETNCWGDAETS